MQRLATVRRAAGLSQRALAERSGVHVQTIRHLEQGRTASMRVDTLTKLASAIGCSIEDLVASEA